MRRTLRPLVPFVALAVLGLVACSDSDDGAADDRATTTTAPTPETTVPVVNSDCRGLPPTASYAPAANLQFSSGSTMAEIESKGFLTVGVSADTLLFGAQNPLSGEIEGFDIDMLKLVARAIFGNDDPANIQYKVITYAQRIPSLQDGSVDLVAHTMTINCTRWNQIAFSSTYYDSGQMILVKRTLGEPAAGERRAEDTTIETLDADGKTVCAPAGSTNVENVADYQGIDLVQVADITDCLVEFQQGRVDAVTADDTVLFGFAKQDPYAVVVGDRFSSEPYGIGVAAERKDLVQFVNRVLADARADGRWTEIYQRWLGDLGEAPAPPAPEPVIRPIG